MYYSSKLASNKWFGRAISLWAGRSDYKEAKNDLWFSEDAPSAAWLIALRTIFDALCLIETLLLPILFLAIFSLIWQRTKGVLFFLLARLFFCASFIHEYLTRQKRICWLFQLKTYNGIQTERAGETEIILFSLSLSKVKDLFQKSRCLALEKVLKFTKWKVMVSIRKQTTITRVKHNDYFSSLEQ